MEKKVMRKNILYIFFKNFSHLFTLAFGLLIIMYLNNIAKIITKDYPNNKELFRVLDGITTGLSSSEDGKVYGKVPYGFSRQGENLIINKYEKKVLDKMYRLKDTGNSYQKISDFQIFFYKSRGKSH